MSGRGSGRVERRRVRSADVPSCPVSAPWRNLWRLLDDRREEQNGIATKNTKSHEKRTKKRKNAGIFRFAPRSQALLGNARSRSSASSHQGADSTALLAWPRPSKQSFEAVRSQAELGNEADQEVEESRRL